jgi:hypothetical protein
MTHTGIRLYRKRVAAAACLLFVAVLVTTVLYLILLCHPGLFFPYAFTQDGITLHSDEPIPASSASQVLRDVTERVSASPLVERGRGLAARVHICNRFWRFTLFANVRNHVGGVAYPPLSHNIFLRAAHIDANRLVGPSGQEVPGERTLAYFIAHEITHTLIAAEVGPLAYLRLAAWRNEGYADHVAKGPDFRFHHAVAQLRAGAVETDPARSGLYLKYQLLVDYVLEQKGKSVQELLHQDFDPAQLEAEILRGSARPL